MNVTKKPIKMIYSNITWLDISKHLNVSVHTIYNWRDGKDGQKHEVLNMAVEAIKLERQGEVANDI